MFLAFGEIMARIAPPGPLRWRQALPGAVNLTLFGERVEALTYGAMPPAADNPRPDVFLATVLVTDAGAPTAYAMHHTCYDGDHHRQFAAWTP